MSTTREAFLQRVRQAVADGNRPGAAAEVPARGAIGYQGQGPDPVARFCAELNAVGGHAHVVPDQESAVAKVFELVREHGAKRFLLGRGTMLDDLGLADRLRHAGLQVVVADTAEATRDACFAADVGITGVAYLIAETGTVALASRPDEPRTLGLLPPVHLAVAGRSQLLPDLFDLFDRLAPDGKASELPSCLALATGPSKTGDIELRLVTGVHGPGVVHVVLVDG